VLIDFDKLLYLTSYIAVAEQPMKTSMDWGIQLNYIGLSVRTANTPWEYVMPILCIDFSVVLTINSRCKLIGLFHN